MRIYGLKWITTSKQSWLPRGREWRICSNMKVAKWVEAPTGTFIKQSAKTGKRYVEDIFLYTHTPNVATTCILAT